VCEWASRPVGQVECVGHLDQRGCTRHAVAVALAVVSNVLERPVASSTRRRDRSNQLHAAVPQRLPRTGPAGKGDQAQRLSVTSLTTGHMRLSSRSRSALRLDWPRPPSGIHGPQPPLGIPHHRHSRAGLLARVPQRRRRHSRRQPRHPAAPGGPGAERPRPPSQPPRLPGDRTRDLGL